MTQQVMTKLFKTLELHYAIIRNYKTYYHVAVVARRIFKRFPEARQVDKETPYNERRKMGHFSWTCSLTSDQVVINLYVVHKVCVKVP